MTTERGTGTRDRIRTALRAFENRDAVAAASTYAADGVFIDPQYPATEYRGRETIRAAFEWALTNRFDRPAYTITRMIEDRGTCAVEADTHHRGADGTVMASSQVFVVDAGVAGISRWRTYYAVSPRSVDPG